MPEEAVRAFDAGEGLPTLLRMLTAAQATNDGHSMARIMGALAGIRIHGSLRWAALRAAGGPGVYLEPILVIASQRSLSEFLPTAVMALARALIGLRCCWTQTDSVSFDAAVARSLIAHGRTVTLPYLKARLGAVLTRPALADTHWEQVRWCSQLLIGLISTWCLLSHLCCRYYLRVPS